MKQFSEHEEYETLKYIIRLQEREIKILNALIEEHKKMVEFMFKAVKPSMN